MADERPASPTADEREKLDKEARAREQEEQSQLPYKWVQTIQDLDLTAPVPAHVKGKDLDVTITKTGLRAGITGQEPLIEVCSSCDFSSPPTLSAALN
jgi:HSP20 family molecular chaperone IbpA